MKISLATLFCLVTGFAAANGLQIVEQDYPRARQLAAEEGKLLFVDFYTTWCAPCKQIDRLVFRDDVAAAALGEHVVLLRYDAERDTAHHLTLKYHVASYPTGVLLTPDGKLISAKYGFPGEGASGLQQSVQQFVDEGVALHAAGTYVSGYSADVVPELYPDFYRAFVERDNTNPDPQIINAYLEEAEDPFAEPYFSTLFYFADVATDTLAERVAERQARYTELYGELNTRIVMASLARATFNRAIEAEDSLAFAQARAYTARVLGKESLANMLPGIELQYLQAQGRWAEVIERHAAAKVAGERDNGYLNHISYTVYQKSDDPTAIATCLQWMKEVTAADPQFDYLDTYAFLLAKAGQRDEAARVARQAIKVGEAEDRKTAGLEKLLEGL